MKFKLTRRDWLGLAGGTAVGAVLTPAPWKAIDDLAIWTQNWKWIPKPPKGEVTAKTTVCALCPAGCAMEARCVAGLPVSLKAAGNEAKGLCPLGITGHHLPYHPARLTHAVRFAGGRKVPTTIARATSDCSSAIRRGGFAVLDMREGRSVSYAWRELAAALPSAVYIAAPGREGASLTTAAAMLGTPIGIDTDNAKAILSFGAPLAEGWGTPRLRERLLARDNRPLLIHVDPVQSRTADVADGWLPAKPGTEGTLALGIANVLLAQGLASKEAARARDFAEYRTIVETFTPTLVASLTGISPQVIVETARELAANAPAVVIAGEDPAGGRFDRATETAILGLNILLGSINVAGGLVPRAEVPAGERKLAPATELDQVADRSISFLIVDASAGDGAFPWRAIERKLQPNALVVALSPFLAGTAGHATIVVPTAPFLEGDHEVAGAGTGAAPDYTISASVLPVHDGAVDVAKFIRDLAAAGGVSLSGTWTTTDELIADRLATIHAAKQGTVTAIDGTAMSVTELESPDALRDKLKEGARWTAAPAATKLASFTMLGGRKDEVARLTTIRTDGIVLLPRADRDVASTAAVSPVMTKLYQESALRQRAATATLNPATARELGLRAGRTAKLRTAAGTMEVTIATGDAVMPGVAVLSVAPDPLSIGVRSAEVRSRVSDICPVDDRGTWRAGSARLEA